MLLEVLAMQLPVREYVTCVLFFTQVPRAFVDQEDRARIGASHWQRSLRVVDLCNYATNKDYFRPKEIVKNDEASAVYDHAMAVCQEAYKALVDMGIRRDLARGVIPLHVNTAGSTAFNLNSILHLVAKRACYFAQGSYWGPIIKAIIEEMGNHFPPALMKKMFKLPCAGSDSCPYMKDIMDRMYDCSNPICPLVIERYIPEEGYAVEHVGVMTRHDAYFWSCENFPGYDEEYKKFLATFN
jgi:thymidylate synthase ThyX